VSSGNISGAQQLENLKLQASYAYSHTSLPCAQSLTLIASAQDSKQHTDFDTDMLPDEVTLTG
jgi:hypothetical protein